MSADELAKAVLRRDAPAVEALLNKGADINAKGSSGNTALIQASVNGYQNMVKLLLQRGANVNIKGTKGVTALMGAAGSRAFVGNTSSGLPVVQTLLDSGADVRAKTDDGKTALEFAHQVKDSPVVEAILRAEGRGRPYTPELDMTDSAKWGWLDSLPSETSLHEAIGKRDKELVDRLLRGKGVDVNADYMGTPPLYEAVAKRQKEIAEVLLTHGADVNAKGLFGSESPLKNAATKGFPPRKVDKELVKMLLAHGADVDTGGDEVTPLQMVAQEGDTEIASILIGSNANVNAPGYKGWTALHRAAMDGRKDMVELLLSHGAKIDAKDAEGRTPFDWAIKNGHKEVGEVLQQHGGH